MKRLNGTVAVVTGASKDISASIAEHLAAEGASVVVNYPNSNAISVSLSQELGPRKIRVNSLDPGMIETEGLRASGLSEGAFREQVERQTPLG